MMDKKKELLIYHMAEILRTFENDFESMGMISISVDKGYMAAFAFERDNDKNKVFDITVRDR